MYISVGAYMSFCYKKEEFDRCFNRLDRPAEESRPDRQPDRPVDRTGFHLCVISKPYQNIYCLKNLLISKTIIYLINCLK